MNRMNHSTAQTRSKRHIRIEERTVHRKRLSVSTKRVGPLSSELNHSGIRTSGTYRFLTRYALPLSQLRILCPRNGRGLCAESLRSNPARWTSPRIFRARVQSIVSPQPRTCHARSLVLTSPSPRLIHSQSLSAFSPRLIRDFDPSRT